MGVSWIVMPEPEKGEAFDYPETFRGQRVVDTELPRDIVGDAFRDLLPHNMETFATALEHEVTSGEVDCCEETVSEIRDAVEWLRYWSDLEYSVHSWW